MSEWLATSVGIISIVITIVIAASTVIKTIEARMTKGEVLIGSLKDSFLILSSKLEEMERCLSEIRVQDNRLKVLEERMREVAQRVHRHNNILQRIEGKLIHGYPPHDDSNEDESND